MAHDTCNKLAVKDPTLKCFLHNFQNYDSMFLLQSLGHKKIKSVTGIPHSREKFMCLDIGTEDGNVIRFLDSYKFLNQSLASIADTLDRDGYDHFNVTKQIFNGRCADMTLLSSKVRNYYRYVCVCKAKFFILAVTLSIQLHGQLREI